VILKAAWVVPVSTPPIRDGYVAVENQQITAVGPAAELPSGPADLQDLGEAALTPGLINPHTHLELTCYAGKLPPGPFWHWIAELVRLRRRPGRLERERAAAAEGAWQSLQAGVTCVGDVSRENVAWQALKRIPIRKVCFVELLTLADAPPRDPQELATAVAAVQEDDLLTVGISPHAPYTVPEGHIRAAIGLARELGRPWCTHWAETLEEVAFLNGDTKALPWLLRGLLRQCGVQSPRMSPGQYLDRCAGTDWPGLLAHGNYFGPADIDRLSRSGHRVVYCPRAHRFFGHRAHPFEQLRAAGVGVAIGTDSPASNESLSLLEELQYLRRNLPVPPTPDELLRLVTLEAARALRLDARIGSLEVGKAADLAAFPCPADQADPLTPLLDQAPRPVAVWVAGRRLI